MSSCSVPSGTVDTVLSYCHYSLNDMTLASLLPYLEEKSVGVINASILSMGLLTPQVKGISQLAAHMHRYTGPP